MQAGHFVKDFASWARVHELADDDALSGSLRFSNIRWTLKFPEKSVRFWNFPERDETYKIMMFLLLALFMGRRLQRKVKFMLYIYFTSCYIEQI